MGLSNDNGGGGKTFVTIVGGKWTIRVPEGTDGAVARELTKGPNMGSFVHEKYYSTLSGNITGAMLKNGEYGTDFCLFLEDDGETFDVKMPVPSDYFRSFAKASPNIDVSKELVIGLGQDKEKGHPFLFLKQGDQTVKSAFTKAEPNGMPEWEKKEVMGKVKWDQEKQNDFLYGKLVDFCGVVEDKVLDDLPI